MNIIACYKIVPEEQDIAVNSDRTLALDKAEPKISQYDLNAVEAGILLNQEAGGGTVVALSVGGKKKMENSKARKDILSRGPDSLTQVIDDKFDGILPCQTASVLAAAAKKIGFDLIICGEGSGDLYAQQVGVQLGELLGVPTINAVNKITAGSGSITVERSLEDEVEVLELALPAVITVTTDINLPKIPTMKAILAAGKKPITAWTAADVAGCECAGGAEMVSILAPKQADRKKIILEGDSDENIAAFAENLRKALN